MSAPPKPEPRGQVARDLFREYAQTHDPALRERLVLAHVGLATYLARKFAYRGERLEDLSQVAQVGLLHAIDRYDLARNVEFSTFATATIVGEIKRHFRDKTWAVHVPRRLRELNNTLMQVIDRLTVRFGRSPTITEVAEEASVPFEDVVEALEVGRAYAPASLDSEMGPDDAGALGNHVGREDPALGQLEDQHTIQAALQRLPKREQMILRLRYFEERSQAEIARQLGISQMHVSRLQRVALQRLREILGD